MSIKVRPKITDIHWPEVDFQDLQTALEEFYDSVSKRSALIWSVSNSGLAIGNMASIRKIGRKANCRNY